MFFVEGGLVVVKMDSSQSGFLGVLWYGIGIGAMLGCYCTMHVCLNTRICLDTPLPYQLHHLGLLEESVHDMQTCDVFCLKVAS